MTSDEALKAAAGVPASNAVAAASDAGTKREALSAYLDGRGPDPAGPSALDPEYYRSRYPDPHAAKREPRAHYFGEGAREGRYPNLRHEVSVAMQLLHSGLVTPPKNVVDGDDRIQFGLSRLRGDPTPPFNVRVDPEFIGKHYPYSLRGIADPIAVAAALMRRRGHLSFNAHLRRLKKEIALSGLFDEEEYRQRVILPDPRLDDDLDPILYYLTEGWRRFASPAQFSDLHYLAISPDVLRESICPLEHYLLHGRSEGRERRHTHQRIAVEPARRDLRLPGPIRSLLAPLLPRRRSTESAPRAGAAGPRTVMFVTHESSRTGAPLLALNVCESLAQSFDLAIVSLKSGTLDTAFEAAGGAFYVKPLKTDFATLLDETILPRHDIDVVVVNTLACADAVADCAARDLRVLLLVHDFATYVRPVEHVCRSLLHCESAIFPSALVREDAFYAVAEDGLELDQGFALVHHQGRVAPAERPDPEALALLDAFIAEHAGPSKPLVVMAAGYAQTRKGVTLFIDACHHALRKRPDANILFVWIGAGYTRTGTDELSIFVSAQIRRQKLEDRLLFVGETTALNEIMTRGDGFILSSILDPFPNVAVDALCNGLPVVCFEDATGIADLKDVFPELVEVVPYRDAAALGDWTLRLLDRREPVSPSLRQRVIEHFEPGIYNTFIVGEIERLRALDIPVESPASLAARFDYDVLRNLAEMRYACGLPPERRSDANTMRTWRQISTKCGAHRWSRNGTRMDAVRHFTGRGGHRLSLPMSHRSFPLLDDPLELSFDEATIALAGNPDPLTVAALQPMLAPVSLLPMAEADGAAGLFRGLRLLAAFEGEEPPAVEAKLRRLLNALAQETFSGTPGNGLVFCSYDKSIDCWDENAGIPIGSSAALIAVPADGHAPIEEALQAARFDEKHPVRSLLAIAAQFCPEILVPLPRDVFPVDIRAERPMVDIVPLPV